ncbi:MAG: hypothetical protein ACTSYN_01490 [Candidatus Heimdallarchaeaceae archaeon]
MRYSKYLQHMLERYFISVLASAFLEALKNSRTNRELDPLFEFYQNPILFCLKQFRNVQTIKN